MSTLLSCLSVCHTAQATLRAGAVGGAGGQTSKKKLNKFKKMQRRNHKKKKKEMNDVERNNKNNNNSDISDAEEEGTENKAYENTEQEDDGVHLEKLGENELADENFGDFMYNATSPDEKALVEACQR